MAGPLWPPRGCATPVLSALWVHERLVEAPPGEQAQYPA